MIVRILKLPLTCLTMSKKKPYPVAVLHSAGFSAIWVPNY